jgi:hypothetical protein
MLFTFCATPLVTSSGVDAGSERDVQLALVAVGREVQTDQAGAQQRDAAHQTRHTDANHQPETSQGNAEYLAHIAITVPAQFCETLEEALPDYCLRTPRRCSIAT